MLNTLHNILQGWKGYVWETKEIEAMAKDRAIECSRCEYAVKGFVAELFEDGIKDIEGLKCDLCDCPLSGLLRSEDSQCKLGKWQKQTK